MGGSNPAFIDNPTTRMRLQSASGLARLTAAVVALLGFSLAARGAPQVLHGTPRKI